MNKKFIKHLPTIVAFTLIIGYILVKLVTNSGKENGITHNTTATLIENNGFNRNPEKIIFTKHANCRMDCRNIDSLEVDEILKTGIINYKKTDTSVTNPCRKKYALEGKTRDNQQVRIIFSPCEDTQTVVTVIDLNTEWECDCR